ncbi:MAG: PorP/SprF family type IX secretion system membrane protein [Janthinobacterium lividum]
MKFSLLALATLLTTAAHAQDVYFSQPYANRQQANPAWAGLVDDYSATLSFRDQLPQFAGSFITTQLAADWRLPQPGLHHALGVLISRDQAGTAGYTRLEASAQYAYHTRLTRELALSGGATVGYGHQRVGYGNLTFGDQLAADGTLTGPSAESLSDFPAANYLTLGVGAVLYTQQFWLSVSGHHLNRPDLGFQTQAQLPARLAVSGGFKIYVRPPESHGRVEANEISFTPVAGYSQQGGSRRTEAGVYFLAQPITLGAVYRNLTGFETSGAQHVLAAVAGVAVGDLRIGYSYDVGLSRLAQDLGGAHEITLTLRAFDKLESAYRKLKRRNYPLAPCPSF